MKKILSIATMAAILTTGAMADETKGEFFLSGGSVKSADKSTTDGAIGWGVTKYYDNGVLLGTNLYLGGSGSDEVFAGVDAKLGYSYKNAGIYAIGSGMIQGLGGTNVNGDGGNTAYGFGGGIGVEYRFEKFAISAETKSYSMQSTLPTYTMKTNLISLKYLF